MKRKNAKMSNAKYREYKAANIPSKVILLRMAAIDALNILDELLLDWKDRILDKGVNAKEHIKTIEALRKIYLKRLLGEMQPKVDTRADGLKVRRLGKGGSK